MAVDKNKLNQLADRVAARARHYHARKPGHALASHYAEAFKNMLPGLRREERLTDKDVSALRTLVLEKLRLKK